MSLCLLTLFCRSAGGPAEHSHHPQRAPSTILIRFHFNSLLTASTQKMLAVLFFISLFSLAGAFSPHFLCGAFKTLELTPAHLPTPLALPYPHPPTHPLIFLQWPSAPMVAVAMVTVAPRMPALATVRPVCHWAGLNVSFPTTSLSPSPSQRPPLTLSSHTPPHTFLHRRVFWWRLLPACVPCWQGVCRHPPWGLEPQWADGGHGVLYCAGQAPQLPAVRVLAQLGHPGWLGGAGGGVPLSSGVLWQGELRPHHGGVQVL